MKIIAVIPSRYNSSRFRGKALADICGKPMVWWVYRQVMKVSNIDGVYVATDSKEIFDICKEHDMNVIMTSDKHDTPTSRLYEVSTIIDGDKFVFVGGDEPLINPQAIEKVVQTARDNDAFAVNAMTKIKTSPEVVDFTNIKVVTNTAGYLLYTTRGPLPYPKGGLDFDYYKFVGIGVFSREALYFYNNTPKSKLERIEECDLLRFIDKFKPVQMVEVDVNNISVDTPKDLEVARVKMEEYLKKENLI